MTSRPRRAVRHCFLCRDCGRHTETGNYVRELCRPCYRWRLKHRQWTGPNGRRLYLLDQACLDCGRTRVDVPRRTLIRGRCQTCYARAVYRGAIADLVPTWPCRLCGQFKPYLHGAMCNSCHRAARRKVAPQTVDPGQLRPHHRITHRHARRVPPEPANHT